MDKETNIYQVSQKYNNTKQSSKGETYTQRKVSYTTQSEGKKSDKNTSIINKVSTLDTKKSQAQKR